MQNCLPERILQNTLQKEFLINLRYNIDGSNMDGPFTVDDPHSDSSGNSSDSSRKQIFWDFNGNFLTLS